MQVATIGALLPRLKAKAVALCHRDKVAADELVQETFIRWLETPPWASTDVDLFHWLGTIIKNMKRDQARERAQLDDAELRDGCLIDRFDLVFAGKREEQLEAAPPDDW